MLRKAARRPHRHKLSYQQLQPRVILGLNQSEPQALEITKQQFERKKHTDVFVVSHEFLQEKYIAVRNICDIAADLGFQSVRIVGYTRRQDQWHRSSFNQWSFRNSNQLKQSHHVFEGLKCDWELFSGYERWLITCLIKKQGPDWNAHYQHHNTAISGCSLPATLCSNPIPNGADPAELLHHFNQICDLKLKQAFINRCKPVKNSSFSEFITETVADSILYGKNSVFPITPHSNNQLLRRLSTKLPRCVPEINAIFTAKLRTAYLSLFQKANQEYCKRFRLSFSACFEVPGSAFLKNEAEITSFIQEENYQRSLNIRDIMAGKAEIHAVSVQALLSELIEQRQQITRKLKQ